MSLSRLVVSATISCLLCGCGTINNAVVMSYGHSYYDESDPPPDDRFADYVYGGVKYDVGLAGHIFTREDVPLIQRLWCLLIVADVPLSAVCDTLYLPATIPATQREADWRREAEALKQKAGEVKDAAFDDERNQMPGELATGYPDDSSDTDANVAQEPVRN